MSIIKQVITRLDDELHKKLKIITAQQGTTIQKVIEEYLKTYVEQNQAPKGK